MYDLEWDIETQDLVVSGTPFANSFDIDTTVNPSVQNGGILLLGRGMNIQAPNYGIGIGENINGNSTTAAAQYNRWKIMCFGDAATLCIWNYKPAIQDVALQISYLPLN
jgi:hypothetical protein